LTDVQRCANRQFSCCVIYQQLRKSAILSHAWNSFKNIHDCRNWIGPLVFKEKRSWITRDGKFSNGYPTSNLAVLNVDKSFDQAPGRAPDELEGHIRDSPPLGEGG